MPRASGDDHDPDIKRLPAQPRLRHPNLRQAALGTNLLDQGANLPGAAKDVVRKVIDTRYR